ncbi:MAG TPA: MerR family transcriptional regulator [Acidimicrobiales bacterium]|nr:MerR family transcriptional regulator [Acidimicrobiales bacterium]
MLVTIGDFSRMTHLSVKALRHYHDVGLLEPAEVDRFSGYRLYDAEQVPIAQVIRRFRDLGMPVEQVKAVLEAPDVETRNKVIVAHLERMEAQLEETRSTVASLRAVLEAPPTQRTVTYRTTQPTTALVIRDDITVDEFMGWWQRAFEELHGALEDSGATRSGPDGALYPGEFFELERGEVTAFIPITGPMVGDTGRAELIELAPIELAVMVHEGSYDDIDRTYGALGLVVAERAIGVDGPIREQYLISPFDTTDESAYRTEVCWPVFLTTPASGRR